jgi:hypothetical protein
MTSAATTTSIDLADLRRRVVGRVVTAEDEDYEVLRQVRYGAPDPHPVAVVLAADAEDVAEVVTVARESGVELAVRSGGHSAAGHGTSQDGLVLDLRELSQVELDVARRTAWAGPGATAGEYTTLAAEHGLVTPFGDTGSVGLGGLTLGGGIGYLARKHGLTIDSLLAAEVVTADGELRLVDAGSHPDLFWAIRGGGGNVGVVTRLQLRTYELPRVVGGLLVLPATAGTVSELMSVLDQAPDELSGIAHVMAGPPLPFLPAEHHGTPVVLVSLCWAGDPDQAEQALAPVRAVAAPIADLIEAKPYPQLFPAEQPGPQPLAVGRTLFLDSVGSGGAQQVLDAIAAPDSLVGVVQLRALGGAVAGVPAGATAYAHRASRVMANVAAVYPTADLHERAVADTTALAGALRQGDERAYVNFLGDEGPDRVRAAYPGDTWTRLQQVKATYDPTNVFRRNQNVPPTP